jgi:hypothetical protein
VAVKTGRGKPIAGTTIERPWKLKTVQKGGKIDRDHRILAVGKTNKDRNRDSLDSSSTLSENRER